MTKRQLIEMLNELDCNDYDVVICKHEFGGWDNISHIEYDGTDISIVFGGGSPFINE